MREQQIRLMLICGSRAFERQSKAAYGSSITSATTSSRCIALRRDCAWLARLADARNLSTSRGSSARRVARACDTCERHSVRKRRARRNARETRAASTSGACLSRVDFRLATINLHRRSARADEMSRAS